MSRTVFHARYAGVCACCGDAIEPGDRITMRPVLADHYFTPRDAAIEAAAAEGEPAPASQLAVRTGTVTVLGPPAPARSAIVDTWNGKR